MSFSKIIFRLRTLFGDRRQDLFRWFPVSGGLRDFLAPVRGSRRHFRDGVWYSAFLFGVTMCAVDSTLLHCVPLGTADAPLVSGVGQQTLFRPGPAFCRARTVRPAASAVGALESGTHGTPCCFRRGPPDIGQQFNVASAWRRLSGSTCCFRLGYHWRRAVQVRPAASAEGMGRVYSPFPVLSSNGLRRGWPCSVLGAWLPVKGLVC